MANFNGTTGSDNIVGTSGDDIINARTSPAGSDTIDGGDGNDTIYSGVEAGDVQVVTVIHGGAGNDAINFDISDAGSLKSVSIYGDAGDDQIVLTGSFQIFSPVVIDGGDGMDSLSMPQAELSQSVVFDNIEHLYLSGFSGPASVVMSADQVRGVDGAISAVGSNSTPLSIYVGSGTGAVDFTQSPGPLNISAASGITSVTGTAYSDQITGGPGAAIYGGAGDDTITAQSGTVDAGSGNDTVDLSIGNSPGVADGGDGIDTLDLTFNSTNSAINVDSIDISSGTPYTLLGGEIIRNFENLERLTIIGDGNVVAEQSRSTEIYIYGNHNSVQASSNTTAVEIIGQYGSSNSAHIVPAGVGEQVSLIAQGFGANGSADIDFSSAVSTVHFGTIVGPGAYQGGSSVDATAYVGDSLATASSSVTVFAGTITIEGGSHDDVLVASPTIFSPTEELHGGGGNDLVVAGPQADVLDGGAGVDTLSFDVDIYGAASAPSPPSGVTVDLGNTNAQQTGISSAVIIGFENLTGSQGNDKLSGDAGDNVLSGLAGDDALYGEGGNDTLIGGAGNNTLDGGDGTDTAIYSGFAHDYAVSMSGSAGRISGGPEGGMDTLTSVENVQFSDGTLTSDVNSTAAEIVRLYDSFLGRAPDAAGFDSYLDYIAAGHTFQDMANNAAASPEFVSATTGLTDAQYITYVYEHSLHREPDPAGLQQYEQALSSGALTRTSMIVQAAESPEHVALTAPLVAAGLWQPNEKVEGLELLYDAAVQRQPDPMGLAAYSAEFVAGRSFDQIANQMASSAEFQAAHAGQSDAQYIDSLYMAEVGRHADSVGLQAYEAELANGYTRGDILYQTAMSQEHQSHVLAFYDPILATL